MTAPGELLLLARPQVPLPDAPSHRGHARSRYCADTLDLAVRVVDGVVVEAGWNGIACAICRASANALCGQLPGLGAKDLPQLADALDDALAGSSTGPFATFAVLVGQPGRHACARLPHEALRRALEGSHDTPAAPEVGAFQPGADAWSVALAYRQRGLDVAMATLIDVVGSSPCPVGSHLVVASDGSFWGAVSGGCVESSVVRAGLELLAGDRRPRVLGLQIANSQAGTAELPCGGQIRVHLAVAPGVRDLRRYQARGRGLVRRVDLKAGTETLVAGDQQEPRCIGSRFEQPLTRRPRLLLIGGTAVAQSLAALAPTVGFDVTVVEPRPGFAGPGRFVCPVVDARPEDWLAEQIDAATAVLMLTHDAAIDDPGLVVALQSPAFYVGALGSRKTQRARLERLRSLGVPPNRLAALRGPAGLAIGAVGPAEIALSMLAEVVATRRSAYPIQVGAVVLAAGSSRRAGPVNKLTVEVDGEPMVRRVVRRALEAGIGPIVVVTGHDRDTVAALLQDLPVQLTHNAAHASGMASSIGQGIESIAAHGVSGAFVLLGDMPWVRTEDLATLAAAHHTSTRHLIVAPVGPGGRRGNPVLWPASLFPELQRLRGDVGGRGLIERAGEAVATIEIEHDGIFRDLDRIP